MHARCRDCIEEHAEKPVDNNILQQSSYPTPSWLLKEGNSSTVSLRGPATTGRSSSIGNRWRCNPAPAGDSAMRRRRWKPGPEGLQVSSGTRRMTIQSLRDCSGMASYHLSSRVLATHYQIRLGTESNGDPGCILTAWLLRLSTRRASYAGLPRSGTRPQFFY